MFSSILNAETKEKNRIHEITPIPVAELTEEDYRYDINKKLLQRDNAQNQECIKHQHTSTESYEDNKISSNLPVDFDTIISIPNIELEKIVYTGKHREEHLKEYELITATDDMQYKHGGNYIICGHTSRIYGHSLNRLKEVQVGDKVYIWNNDLSDEYVVISINFEFMNNTSEFCKQTKSKQITILSCANHISDDKYIVIKCKKNN